MLDTQRFNLKAIAATIFLATLVLGGGSSRHDMVQQIIPQIGSVALLAVLLFSMSLTNVRELGLPALFLALMAMLLITQLIPFPPSVWEALPGRELYVASAELSTGVQPYRPISLSPDRTTDTLLSLLPVIAATLVLALGAQRFRHQAMMALVVIAICSTILAAFQLAGGPSSALRFYRLTNTDFGVGFLANRNHQALLLAMAIPAVAWWAVRNYFVKSRPWLLATLSISVIALLLVGAGMTGSRMGLVLSIIAILGSILLAWPVFAKIPKAFRMAILGVGGCIVIAAAAVIIPEHRALTGPLESDLRVQIWPRAVEGISAFFPAGSGFGAFDRTYPRFELPADLGPEYINRAHNDFLEIIYEGGLAAVVMLVAFLAWFGLASWRVWTTKLGRIEDLTLARSCSIIVLVGLVASLTDYPLRTSLMASLFAGASVMLYIVSANVKNSKSAEAT